MAGTRSPAAAASHGPARQCAGALPADAIVLFDGKDLSQWDGGDPKGVEDGCINIEKTGQIYTKQNFGDCQLHVEWATPAVADGNVMNWGNSGVLFFGKYEFQIIESYAAPDCTPTASPGRSTVRRRRW